MGDWVYVVRWRAGKKFKQREFDGDQADAESHALFKKLEGNRNEAVRSRIRKATVGDRVVSTGRGILKKIIGG